MSSSVPSRMLASGVFSSCDMWRRKRLRSCARSSRRLRSHSSCPPRRSRSCGPETAIGLVKVPSPSSLIARSSWRSGRPDADGEHEHGDRPRAAASRAACHSRRLRACSVRSSSSRDLRVDLRVALLCHALNERGELREAGRQVLRGRRTAGGRGGHHGRGDALLQGAEFLERLARLGAGLPVQLLARALQALILRAVDIDAASGRSAPRRGGRCARGRRSARTAPGWRGRR